ncbi:hypothetical protein [Halorussus caseinilyticus]|uniref:Uncharacterized protein n=1 Tax=Halorussus caseinilyticus TaxID=3034025 RepID=A0ABD5WQP0_9EURY
MWYRSATAVTHTASESHREGILSVAFNNGSTDSRTSIASSTELFPVAFWNVMPKILRNGTSASASGAGENAP